MKKHDPNQRLSEPDQANTAMFRRLVECAGQGIGWADLDGNIVYMNPALRQMLDLAPETEASGLHLSRFCPPEAGPVADEMLRATLEQGSWSGEINLLSEQGRVIPTRHDIHLIRDAAGAPIAFGCAITDLSQQKQLEKYLVRSRAKYRALVENIPQRVFYKDRQSIYLAVNRQYANDKGLSPEEVIGLDDYALNTSELAVKYRADDRRIMASGLVEEYDEPHQRDGKKMTVHTVKTPVKDEDGLVIGICGIYWDVTEQRAAFERVEMLQRVVDFSPQSIGWVDLDGTARYFNPALRRLLALPETADVHRYHLDNFYSEAQRQTLQTRLLPEVMDKGHWSGELELTALDGQVIPAQHTVFQIRDSLGQPIALANVLTDLRAKKSVEASLRRSEETYARAEAIAHLGSWSWDIARGTLRWSDEIYRIFGRVPQSVAATFPAFLDAIHPDDRQKVIDATNASVTNPDIPYNVEHRVLHPDGEVRIVHERGKVYCDSQGKPTNMIGSVQDTTEQKHAAMLQANELFKQAILDSMLAQIAVLDRNGVIVAVNQAWRNFALANSAVLPGLAAFETPAALTSIGVNYLEVCQTSDGDSSEEVDAAYAGIRAVLDGHLPSFELEYPCHSPDQQRWVVMMVSPLSVEDRGVVITHTDITARRLAQDAIRSARDEAERANRAKSEFLSRMSHELRTPLNAIIGFGQLLERANLTSMQTDNAREILNAGNHLLTLINEVLDLARIDSGTFPINLEPISLGLLIADCLNLIRPLAETYGIRLNEVECYCGTPVLADSTRLKQVLLNLLSNAVKYNRADGSVSVACRYQDNIIHIRVNDTGPGLTEEQQARLFTPFERLEADKNAVEGTGIGLALSKRLVELMGGEIGVESRPGIGSTFWLSLPPAQRSSDYAPANNQPLCPVAETEPTQPCASRAQVDLLCIEDNPANMRLIQRILEMRANIHLLKAHSSSLGLELAAAHRPALILLDINLPEMDGFEVLRRLRNNAATRDIPIIGISANAMPKDIERALAAGFNGYLTKPLEISQFLALVDETLDDLSPVESP